LKFSIRLHCAMNSDFGESLSESQIGVEPEQDAE
jgi:hypothetical protein